MVTVSEATTIIFQQLMDLQPTVVNVEAACGKVLAESVRADRDFPPFDRVSMDGIAIQYEAWLQGTRTFSVQDTQAAGEARKVLNGPFFCLEVMTGAMLPLGCDAVVRYEDIEIAGNNATLKPMEVNRWQSIHRQGMDAQKDQVLLEPGQMLTPAEVALLASVGKPEVRVFSFPRVAIISTGDELVAIDAAPKDYQIRRSNSYALQSALVDMGGNGEVFHLVDEQSAMEKSLGNVVRDFDVLILSGGVSKGKFDYVPAVLEKIGIKKLFHQVSQRPGKPFWFGKSDGGKVAFALPGNPVSTFMCFYKYVKPWILKSMGAPSAPVFAVLGTDFSFLSALTYFLQVSVKNEKGRLVAYPAPGGGSGDFANLKSVTGFVELPLEKSDFRAGEVFLYISFRP